MNSFAEGYAIGRDTNGGNGGSWGNNGAELLWILVILALVGRGGFGGFGGGSGVGENYVLATDFATIERKLDGVNNGLCDGFYAQNTNMLNGFAGVQQTLCQGFSGVNTAITTNGYETRNAITDVGYRLQDCCCKTQRAIDSVNFNMSNNTCALTNAMTLNTRDIIENQNANFRALHDEIVANKIEAKNERIAEQQAQITALQLKASQEAQNNYLVSTLTEKLGTKCPEPAYIVPNPNCCYNYNVTGYGYNNNNCCGL